MNKILKSIFRCPYCSKCFDEKLTFSTHVSKHKALEDKRFNCELCNKSFSSNYYLKTHQKIHNRTTKKSLSCQHCGKRLVDLTIIFFFTAN